MNLKPLRSIHVRPRWGTLTFLILLINAGSTLLTLLHAPSFNYFYAAFPLMTDSLLHGEWWRLFTYIFIHAPADGIGVFHVLFNMVTLAMFGEFVEKELGKIIFMALYVCSGVLSALALIFEHWLRADFSTTQMIAHPHMILGASGAIMGIVAAYAILRPHVRMYMLLIPYPLRINTALILFLIISFGLMFIPGLSFIGHSAHIGGACVGYIWAYIWLKIHPLRHETDFVYTKDIEMVEKEIRDMDPVLLKRYVEQITPKLSRWGIHTLTRREAAILRHAAVTLRTE